MIRIVLHLLVQVGNPLQCSNSAREYPPPVILTTTTHITSWQTNFADSHYQVNSDEDIEQIFGAGLSGVTLLTGPEFRNGSADWNE